MTQIFFPHKHNPKQQHKTYCYTNKLARVVVAKINGLKDRYCERVIFPQEQFLFVADDNCELEICQQTSAGIISDVIACRDLQTINS